MFQLKNDSSLRESKIIKNKILNAPIDNNRINSMSDGMGYLNITQSKQSPKIFTGKLRDNSFDHNLQFSYLDIPIGRIARGTKVPLQYQRRDQNETDQLFNKTTNGVFYVKNKNESVNEILSTNKAIEIGNKEDEENSNFRKSSYNKSKFNPNLTTSSSVNDKWMPHKYREHERLIKTAHCKRDTGFASNIPEVNVKKIKQKMQESDIFFLKESEKVSENIGKVQKNYHKNKAADFQESDVFMIKNNKIALEKSGEKYLETNKSNKNLLFNTWSKSNSEWQPKNSYASLLNHCSSDYHILNPNVKNISKTKEQIFSDSNPNNFNPIYRQKSLCEFIDLTRVGVPNPNKEYLGALKQSKNVFNKESNLCSAYLDVHKMYRGISERPFVKNII